MVGDDDADILVLEFGDDVLDILHGDGIHPRERFVQQDEFRVDGQGTGNLATPPLAARQLDAQALAHFREVEFVDERLQPFLPVGPGHIGHLHHGHDIVLHGHLAEDRSVLREITQTLLRALVHRQTGDVHIVQEDLSRVGDDLSGNHIETGGLSGPVGPEETDDFPLFHFHRHPFDDRPDAVFLYQVFSAQYHLISNPRSMTRFFTSSFSAIRTLAWSEGI